MQFRPSSANLSRYGVASTGAAAGGAVAAETGGGGERTDPSGFLGLNWKSIGAAVVVGTLVAVGTDIALEFVRPLIFKRRAK